MPDTFTDLNNIVRLGGTLGTTGGDTLNGPVTVQGGAGNALTVDGGDAGNDALVVKSSTAVNLLLAGDDTGGVFLESLTGSNSLNVTSAGTEITGRSGFNGTTPIAKPTVTGALSTVADAPAKAVLTSIITALTNYGLVTNGTT